MSIPALEAALDSQRVLSEEIGKIHASAAAGETRPRLAFPPCRAAQRHPAREPLGVGPEGAERPAPVVGCAGAGALESDLTVAGAPIGDRIVVRGPGPGRGWQANAAGRYVHQRDQPPACDHESSQRDVLLGYRWDIVPTGARFGVHLQVPRKTPFLMYPGHQR